MTGAGQGRVRGSCMYWVSCEKQWYCTVWGGAGAGHSRNLLCGLHDRGRLLGGRLHRTEKKLLDKAGFGDISSTRKWVNGYKTSQFPYLLCTLEAVV